MKRYRKTALAVATLCLGVVLALAWHRFWPGPKPVDGGFFELHKVLPEPGGSIWKARFSPDGTLLVSASTAGTATVWTTGGAIHRTLKHPLGVTFADFSPDGKTVATASYDGLLRLWNLEDGALVRTITASATTIWCLAFSPDGETLATAGEDRVISLWNTADGTLLRTLAGHRLNVWAVAFSPDGSSLASSSFDRTLILWQVEDGTLSRVLSGHDEGIVAVAFSPDGSKVVSGSDDGTARLWQVGDGHLIRTLAGPPHVYAVDFSPDGNWLLLAGKDRPMLGELLQNFLGDSHSNKWVTAQLHDAASGDLLQTFAEHANDVNSASFSPDGQWIATASEDGTIDLWRRTDKKN